MATRMTEVGSGLISVERDGKTLTGITTGIPTNSFTIRKLASRRRDNGWLYRDDELAEWRPRGLIEHGGLTFVVSKHIISRMVHGGFYPDFIYQQ